MTSDMKVHTGPRGTATQLDPDKLETGNVAGVATWLLTGPWHPFWTQFLLYVVHLRPIPGKPPATLQFEGATHELVVLALNPGDPPTEYPPELVERKGGGVGYLQPIDVCHQFTATDEEMIQLADLAAEGCVNGFLMPSTDDAREMYREHWLTACVRTLAHMRGEEHAP